MNDAGTAIDVLGRLTRLLSEWNPDAADASVEHERVSAPQLRPRDLMEDAFRPIARDGAGTIEVVLRLLHGLEVIAETNPFLKQEAIQAAMDAVQRAERALQATSDLDALREAKKAFRSCG